MTGQSIVDAAREYMLTPWHHRGRTKGVGIDCCGLLICVLRDVGVPVVEPRPYSLGDEWPLLKGQVEEYACLLPENALPEAGDILLFRGRFMNNHCGFYTGEGNMIHSYQSVQKVVEHRLDERWIKMYLQGYYRLKELATWQQ